MCRIHNYLIHKEEEPMKQSSVSQFGGVCAILLGVVSTLAGITYLLLPPEQRLEVPGAQFLPSYAANPTMINLISYQLALIGILGLAIVPAIAQLVQSENEGWVRWTSSLAYLGYAVVAVENLLTLGRLPNIAAAFVAGDSSTKAVLAVTWRSSLDPQGWFGYAAIGLWIGVMSLLALRSNLLPSPLACLGLVVAILFWLLPISFVLHIPLLLIVVAAAQPITVTIWYFWTGIVLLRPTPSRLMQPTFTSV
jgi:Domain of unknown function (DUF4386)